VSNESNSIKSGTSTTTVVAAGSSVLAFASMITASTVSLPSLANSTRNASSTATSLVCAA
jgi:hypothetical protein